MTRKSLSPRTAAVTVAASRLGARRSRPAAATRAHRTTRPRAPRPRPGGRHGLGESVSGVGNVLVDAQGRCSTPTTRTPPLQGRLQRRVRGDLGAAHPPVGRQRPERAPPTCSRNSAWSPIPDGDQQVTLDGKPLYTFAQDGTGEATGDGVTDSFGGTSFTWTVASAGSASGAAAAQTTTSSSSSSGGGGYGY